MSGPAIKPSINKQHVLHLMLGYVRRKLLHWINWMEQFELIEQMLYKKQSSISIKFYLCNLVFHLRHDTNSNKFLSIKNRASLSYIFQVFLFLIIVEPFPQTLSILYLKIYFYYYLQLIKIFILLIYCIWFRKTPLVTS